jgi:hypothetical protein
MPKMVSTSGPATALQPFASVLNLLTPEPVLSAA